MLVTKDGGRRGQGVVVTGHRLGQCQVPGLAEVTHTLQQSPTVTVRVELSVCHQLCLVACDHLLADPLSKTRIKVYSSELLISWKLVVEKTEASSTSIWTPL